MNSDEVIFGGKGIEVMGDFSKLILGFYYGIQMRSHYLMGVEVEGLRKGCCGEDERRYKLNSDEVIFGGKSIEVMGDFSKLILGFYYGIQMEFIIYGS